VRRKRVQEHAGRLWRRVRQRVPHVYGPRGVILLSLALVCFCFGIAYVGPLAPSTVPAGVRPLTMLMPLDYWGVLWFIGCYHLAQSAFKVNQAHALGGLSGMLTAWALSHFVASVWGWMDGIPNRHWITGVIFGAIVSLVWGVARMLNVGKSHKQVRETPGPPPDGPGGTYGG
jgi:hypothetical protein